MKALIYCRVSQDRKRGRSVREQEAECRQTCAEQGWEVVEVIHDNDRSASAYAKKARPGWSKVEERLKSGDLDVLVVWELSRATREMNVALELRDICKEGRVLISWRGDTYNMVKANDRKRFVDDANSAEYESGQTSERIKRTTRAQAALGKPHGRRLYGYRRIYDADRQLVGQEIDETEAAVIREAAERTIAGESLYAIARDFTAREIKTAGGSNWLGTVLRESLLNSSYVSKRVHRYVDDKGNKVEDEFPGDWPAIFSDETFGQLKAILLDPARKNTSKRERAHLLSGVARCGQCGATMKWWKNRQYNVYACSAAYHNVIGEEYVDEYVTSIILERLGRDDASELVGDDSPPAELIAARERSAELQKRLDEAATQYASGELSASMLSRVEARLLPMIKEAESSARFAGVPGGARKLLNDSDPVAAWAALELAGKVEVVRAVMNVTVNRATRPPGSKGFDPSRVVIEWRND
jgi:DNA invertase Pin-like site-specific DNA recombinase